MQSVTTACALLCDWALAHPEPWFQVAHARVPSAFMLARRTQHVAQATTYNMHETLEPNSAGCWAVWTHAARSEIIEWENTQIRIFYVNAFSIHNRNPARRFGGAERKAFGRVRNAFGTAKTRVRLRVVVRYGVYTHARFAYGRVSTHADCKSKNMLYICGSIHVSREKVYLRARCFVLCEARSVCGALRCEVMCLNVLNVRTEACGVDWFTVLLRLVSARLRLRFATE